MCAETFRLWVIAERILYRHKQQLSSDVWAGIVGECSVGQHVLPHLLTGNRYRDFLLHDLSKLPEDVPLAVRVRMWYMHDGAPAHFSRDVLNNAYYDRWIGRGGPTAWSPRSPDLNTLDFTCGDPYKPLCMELFLTMKRQCTIALWMPVRLFATSPASLNGCGGPWWDVSRHACIESHGRHFERLL
jgi:hypothetical protein